MLDRKARPRQSLVDHVLMTGGLLRVGDWWTTRQWLVDHAPMVGGLRVGDWWTARR